MSGLSQEVRRADALYRSIIQLTTAHRTRFFSEPGAEGFCVYMSVADMRLLDELSKRSGDYFPVSEIKDGDSGTIFGLPCTADASVRVGRVFIGYRADALEVDQ